MNLRTFLNKTIRCVEQALYTNWYNPFATLWLNFRCFSFKQAIHLPVSVYGRPKFYGLEGRMRIEGVKPRRGLITFNRVHIAAPGYCGSQSILLLRGNIIFRGAGQIDTGCKIIVEHDARLDLGDHFKISDCVNVYASVKIVIGNQSRIAHRCQILDSNFHCIADLNKNIIPREKRMITIGNNCWICNSTTVAGGTILSDFTIVGSNSLVNRNFADVPQYSLIAGCPAKFIKSGFVRVDNPQFFDLIWHFYEKNPSEIFQLPPEWTVADIARL